MSFEPAIRVMAVASALALPLASVTISSAAAQSEPSESRPLRLIFITCSVEGFRWGLSRTGRQDTIVDCHFRRPRCC